MSQSEFVELCSRLDKHLADIIWDYLSALFEQET